MLLLCLKKKKNKDTYGKNYNSGVLWLQQVSKHLFSKNAELEDLIHVYYLWFLKFKDKYSQVPNIKLFF